MLIEGLQETDRATAKPFQPLDAMHSGFPAWQSSSGGSELYLYCHKNSWTVGRQLGGGVVGTAVADSSSSSPVGDGEWKVYNAAYRMWDQVPVRVFDLGWCEDATGAEVAAASVRANPPPLRSSTGAGADGTAGGRDEEEE